MHSATLLQSGRNEVQTVLGATKRDGKTEGTGARLE